MANIYIYDPADHNALTQALQLANNNTGKDYVISALAAGEPYWQEFRSSKPANYSANANPGDLGEDYNSISPPTSGADQLIVSCG